MALTKKFGLDVQEAEFKLGKKPEGSDWGVESEEKWGKFSSMATQKPTKPFQEIIEFSTKT